MTDILHTVLILDDEADDIEILHDMFSDEFDVTCCSTFECCKKEIDTHLPGVIILNPAMKGLDAHTIVRYAKDINADCHVIFLSNLTSSKDSIEAYEQGADDFIPKPYNPVELYYKVKRYVDDCIRQTAQDSMMSSARTAAFSAMENNSELGVVLRYMEEITHCNTYGDLGLSLINTVQQFGVKAIAQIRSSQETHNFGCQNDSFEALLLNKSLEKGKIIEGVNKAIINDQRISLLLKSLPSKDDPKYGRIKDNISMMMGSTDSRVSMIELREQFESERKSGILSVIGDSRKSMQEISDNFTQYESNIWENIQVYRENTEGMLMALGLTGEQEDALMEALDAFVDKIIKTDETKNLIESRFTKLLSGLDKLS